MKQLVVHARYKKIYLTSFYSEQWRFTKCKLYFMSMICACIHEEFAWACDSINFWKSATLKRSQNHKSCVPWYFWFRQVYKWFLYVCEFETEPDHFLSTPSSWYHNNVFLNLKDILLLVPDLFQILSFPFLSFPLFFVTIIKCNFLQKIILYFIYIVKTFNNYIMWTSLIIYPHKKRWPLTIFVI